MMAEKLAKIQRVPKTMASIVVIIHIRENNSSIQMSSVQIPRYCPLTAVLEELKQNEDIQSVLRSLQSRSAAPMACDEDDEMECNLDDIPAFESGSIIKFRARPRWKAMLLGEILNDIAREETLESAFGSLLDGKFTIEITTQGQRQWTHEAVVQSVKDLVRSKSLKELIEGGCPLSQGMLSQIAIGKYVSEISRSKRHQFSVWFTRYSAAIKEHIRQDILQGNQHESTAKKRRRISFEPMTEIPVLKAWFKLNNKPDEIHIEKYARELNTRRLRPGVITAENVKIWFKNERQRKGKLVRESVTPLEEQNQHSSLEEDPKDGDEEERALKYYQKDVGSHLNEKVSDNHRIVSIETKIIKSEEHW